MVKKYYFFYFFIINLLIGCCAEYEKEKYPERVKDFSGYVFHDHRFFDFHIKLYKELKEKKTKYWTVRAFGSNGLKLSMNYFTFHSNEWIEFIDVFSRDGKLKNKDFPKTFTKSKLIYSHKLMHVENADAYLFFFRNKKNAKYKYRIYVVIFPYYALEHLNWYQLIINIVYNDYKLTQKIANMLATMKIGKKVF